MIVKKIPAREICKKKRVAAYARVSTNKENQEESFETQVRYYDTLIKSNPNWVFTRVYSDHGFSGVSAEKRPGFMEVVKAAECNEFDILLVRSISRFARNVKEAQMFCRRLRVLGVEVQFEREKISSMDPVAEMAFNLLAACAQEESRSISERTKWSIHKLQEQGILHIGDKALGYEEADRVLTPNDEAWVVKEIFEEYAAGESMTAIAENINRRGFRRKKSLKKLTRDHICYILKNPIYVGDRFFQKQAPKNYMTHKPDWSQAYDSYRVKNTHEGIVDRALWDTVQKRIEREQELNKSGVRVRKDSHFLYGKIFCGECGLQMRRKQVILAGEKTAIWKCADQFKGKQRSRCRNDTIKEEALLEILCTRLAITAERFADRAAELQNRAGEIDRVTIKGKKIEVMLAQRI